jgi:hypothetical protein
MSLSPGFDSTNQSLSQNPSDFQLDHSYRGNFHPYSEHNTQNDQNPPFLSEFSQNLPSSFLPPFDPYDQGFNPPSTSTTTATQFNPPATHLHSNPQINPQPYPSSRPFPPHLSPLDQALHQLNLTSKLSAKPTKNEQIQRPEPLFTAPLPPTLPVPSIRVNESDPAKMLTTLDIEHRTLNHLELLYTSEIARLENEAQLMIDLIKQSDPQIVFKLGLDNKIGTGLTMGSGKMYYEMFGKSLAQNDQNWNNKMQSEYNEQQHIFKKGERVVVKKGSEVGKGKNGKSGKSDKNGEKNNKFDNSMLSRDFTLPQYRPYIPHIEIHDDKIHKGVLKEDLEALEFAELEKKQLFFQQFGEENNDQNENNNYDKNNKENEDKKVNQRSFSANMFNVDQTMFGDDNEIDIDFDDEVQNGFEQNDNDEIQFQNFDNFDNFENSEKNQQNQQNDDNRDDSDDFELEFDE